MIYISRFDSHIVGIYLSDDDINTLVENAGDIPSPVKEVIKRIIYQANDAPFFCSAYNCHIKYLKEPKNATCKPFPYACKTCPMAFYEE